MIKIAVLKIFLPSLFSLYSVFAFADMLYLKSGRSLEGIVEQQDRHKVILNIGPGRITILTQDIDRIDKYGPGKQLELKKKWAHKYFMHPDFIPRSLQDMANEFKDLTNLRDVARQSKKDKDESQERIDELESELKELKAELTRVSRKLAVLKPEDNLKQYNSLVKESNSLTAKIRVDEYEKGNLKEQLIILDKKISRYINDFRLFKKRLIQRYNTQEQDLTEQESIFFESVKREADGMEDDFIKHTVDFAEFGSGIIVDALLNGLINVSLIVDTGAGLVVISKKIAGKLGLSFDRVKPDLVVILADGRKVKAYPVMLESVKVGDAEVKNVRAAVFEKSLTAEEDGLLGMSFLANFIVRMEPKSNKLILEEFSP